MLARYSPPYSSPIEDNMAYNLVKYIAEDVQLLSQLSVETLCGQFIPDFVLELPAGRRIAIECDGRDFHDLSRDEWRDAMILGTGHVESVYRCRGSDIVGHIEDLLFLITQIEPQFFSERGRTNLRVLASDEARAHEIAWDYVSVLHIHYPELTGSQADLFLERHTLHLGTSERSFLKSAYDYAVRTGGGDLDEVCKRFRSAHLISES